MDKYRKYNNMLMENIPFIFNIIHKVFRQRTTEYDFECFWDFYKCKIDSGLQSFEYLSKDYKKYTLIDVPYDMIATENNIELFFDNYNKHGFFDNIQGIIYTLPVSDFCIFDNENKNMLKSNIEYFHKLLDVERFKLCTFVLLPTKYDLLLENIVNGYLMSNCFDLELHEKYINQDEENCFEIWDTEYAAKYDKTGNIQILTHVIPGFIRISCLTENFPAHFLNLIDAYLNIMYNVDKNGDDSRIGIKEQFIADGISRFIEIGPREELLYYTSNFQDVSDDQQVILQMEWIQQSILNGNAKINNKISYGDGKYVYC